jgi:hypothetical protein
MIKAEYDKHMYEVTVSKDGQLYKCLCAKFQRDGLHCCHVFNIATRKGTVDICGNIEAKSTSAQLSK